MPAKNLQRIDVENSYYHVYNRGVEKRIIYQDEQDYKVFLNYLKEYLSPPPKIENLVKKSFTLQGETFKGIARQPNNHNGKVELIAYVLMPNHFHLLIRQITKGALEKFMRSLLTRYSMFFNKKYERVGTLFQGPYKSAIITTEDYLLHLSRYIHRNPLKHSKNLPSAFSSYGDYLGTRNTTWVKRDPVLRYFGNTKSGDFKHINTYKDFVEKYKKKTTSLLEGLVLESENDEL